MCTFMERTYLVKEATRSFVIDPCISETVEGELLKMFQVYRHITATSIDAMAYWLTSSLDDFNFFLYEYLDKHSIWKATTVFVFRNKSLVHPE